MEENHVTVCRLCMSHGEGMLPISSGQANYTKLISVFQLVVLERVGAPSHICNVCVERLDAAYRFKQQILDVERTLQTLYGKVCITTAKSNLAGNLSSKQVDLENRGRNPIYFAEIDTKGREMTSNMTLDKPHGTNYNTSSTVYNNQEDVAIGEEVDPIAIDNRETACWEKTIEMADSRTASGSDTSFAYVSMKTEMGYVSIMDHIEAISFEEILEANKQKELEDAKEARKINNSKFDVRRNCCCLICGQTFWSVKLFTTHMTRHGTTYPCVETHNEVKEFKCLFCKEKFSDNNMLRKHVCPYNKPKIIKSGHVKCSRCCKLFSTEKDLNEHTKSHMHWCSFCGKGVIQEISLMYHLGKRHRKEINLKNSSISEEMENMARLRAERNENISVTPPLKIASANSVSSEVVESVGKIKVERLAEAPYNQQHLQSTDDLVLNDERVFVKEEVDLGTETIGPNYYGHHEPSQTSQTVTVGGNDNSMWQTAFPYKIEPFCEATLVEEEQAIEASNFDETGSIESSIQEEIKTKYCSCLICNTSFQYISQFVKHMKTHDDSQMTRKPKPKRILCTLCKRDFFDTKHYKKHLNNGKCPKIPVSTHLANERARKAKRVGRKKIKPRKGSDRWVGLSIDSVKCSFCSKSFTRAIELDRHRKQHRLMSDMPFICEYCDQKYRTKIGLEHHYKKCPNNTLRQTHEPVP